MLYVFLMLIVLGIFIAWKWDLTDPATWRPSESNEENRLGFALFSLVFIAFILLQFMDIF